MNQPLEPRLVLKAGEGIGRFGQKPALCLIIQLSAPASQNGIHKHGTKLLFSL